MIKNKIAIMAVATTLVIGGCQGQQQEERDPQEETNNAQVQEEEPTFYQDDSTGYLVEISEGQAEINDRLREEAVEKTFKEIHDGESDIKVVLVGEVSLMVPGIGGGPMMSTFTLTTKEDEDSYGIYEVQNVLGYEGIQEGDIVRVYGRVDKTNWSNKEGLIGITSTLIEKVQ